MQLGLGLGSGLELLYTGKPPCIRATRVHKEKETCPIPIGIRIMIKIKVWARAKVRVRF